MARHTTRAGGFLLAVTILGGTALGIALGEPSTGLLAGTAAGTLAALVVWLADRRR